jgi:hypothetical protein
MLDPGEEYYLGESPKELGPDEYTDVGPNWNCGHCGQANRGNATVCRDCNQPRSGDDTVEPVREYVSGTETHGVTFTSDEELAENKLVAREQWTDKLSVLNNEPVSQPRSVQLGKELPRSGADVAADNADGYDVYSAEKQSKVSAALSGITDRLPPGVTRWLKPKVAAIAAVIVLLLGGGTFGGKAIYANYYATETVNLTVQSLTWQRGVEVERFTTLTEEDWDVPSDGRVISQRREVRFYREVHDHYETRYRTRTERVRTGSHSERYVCGSRTVNKGDGTFETEDTYCTRTVDDYETRSYQEPYQVEITRKEPVYDTKYRYEVDRWVTDRYETASGTTDPRWPTPKVSGPRQRVGDERQENYNVVLIDAQGRDTEHDVRFDVWSRLSIGEAIQAEQTRKGTVRDIAWPAN